MISDYIKRYFEPDEDDVRIRDVLNPVNLGSGVAKTGGAILGELQKQGQTFLSGTAMVGGVLTGQPLTPSTYFQRELYGTDKPITPRSFAARFGLDEKGAAAPIVGFALGAADFIPGGQVSKRGAVTLLKNANKADDALRILTKTMGVARDVASKYLDDAVRLTDEKQLASLVDKVVNESQQVSRFVQKGKALLTGTKTAGNYTRLISEEELKILNETGHLPTNIDGYINVARPGREAEVLKVSDDKVHRVIFKPSISSRLESASGIKPSTVQDAVRGRIPKSDILKIEPRTPVQARDQAGRFDFKPTLKGSVAKPPLPPPVVPKSAPSTKPSTLWRNPGGFIKNPFAKGTAEVSTQERKFITSAKAVIPDADRIAGQYIPRGTDQLAIKAKNLIRDDFATAERMALAGSDDNAVAVASELLKKYADDAAKATDPAQASAIYDKAAEVANTLAPKLTEQGRSIQAASILGRLTPEGQVRFAAREIQRFNETAPINKKIPELTGEQTKDILDEMKIINDMADGTEKAMRFQKLQNMIQDLVPTPLMKKITTVWKAGLLTGLKTQGLNILSNLSHGITEITKDAPAAIVDSVAALFTGQRTKTFTLRGSGGGLAEGFEKGIRYFRTGFDERNIGAKLDYHRVNFGKGIVAKSFQAYTDTVFRFLGSQDQPFYYGALSRSLMDQALAQGKNVGFKGENLVKYAEKLLEAPTEDMIRYAVLDATTAVFQNKTKLGEAARAIQKIPGVGEFFLPFARTPSAVAMQIINYSPVGIAKTIIENIGKGKFDQRLFSQGIGRGLTGTAMAAIGVELAKKGLVSLEFPFGDKKEQGLQEVEGKKNNAILIGDKWRSPIILGPAGNLLLVGAHIQKALEESGSVSEAFSKAAFGTFGSFLEQTFVTGLKNALNAITDPETYAKSYLPNLIASFVPTVVSDVARSTDPLERRPESTIERIKARIPGLRRGLEPQVDILGRERERIGNPLEVMADPTRPSPDISTPVTEELRRLMDSGFKVSPTLLGDKQGFKALSPEENTRLWKFTGEVINGKLTSLFNMEKYQGFSDTDKGKTVEKIISQAKVNARAGMAIKLTDGLSGEELKAKLSELKSGGLLTQEVFKKYQELR